MAAMVVLVRLLVRRARSERLQTKPDNGTVQGGGSSESRATGETKSTRFWHTTEQGTLARPIPKSRQVSGSHQMQDESKAVILLPLHPGSTWGRSKILTSFPSRQKLSKSPIQEYPPSTHTRMAVSQTQAVVNAGFPRLGEMYHNALGEGRGGRNWVVALLFRGGNERKKEKMKGKRKNESSARKPRRQPSAAQGED